MRGVRCAVCWRWQRLARVYAEELEAEDRARRAALAATYARQEQLIARLIELAPS